MNVEDRQLQRKLDSSIDESVLAMAAANELSSPLILMRQLGLSLAHEVSDEERKLLAERMTLTSERALRLAASISMMSTEQGRLALEPINPVSVCLEVVHELSPLFRAHGTEIALQQRTRVPLLVANRDILRLILLGFGDNALHYGSDGKPIRMSIGSHAGKVRIGIRDFGPAVPIDIWEKIEKRVTRLAAAPLASRPHVSGVGLMAARRLAELMESSVGLVRHRDGATFYIDLHVSKQMSLLQ